MPELPEVETTRRGVQPHSEGKILECVDIRNASLRWPVSDELYDLNTVKVEKLKRRGKYIIFELSRGAILVHLGMSGSLRVVPRNSLPGKHDHVDFVFHDCLLRFNDPRRFGCILWCEDWTEHSLVSHLGPEPLTGNFHAKYLHQRAKGRTTSIKQFLMDSRIVVGVGNIYANEALFLSGIRPTRMAGKVSLKRMEALVENVKLVLASAINRGGTTLRDFVGGDGKPGYFQQELYVYGRAGEPCKHCSNSLKEVRQNGRSTVFCAKCQT